MCWTAEHADAYFAFPVGQLRTKLTTVYHGGTIWNQRRFFGRDVRFAANQVTWGALRLVNRSNFALYMKLIEKAERAEGV
jgi:hypothetical protein